MNLWWLIPFYLCGFKAMAHVGYPGEGRKFALWMTLCLLSMVMAVFA